MTYTTEQPMQAGGTTEKAKETTREVASQAQHVATEAKEQAKEVVDEVRVQAQELLHRTQQGLREEAETRTERAVDSLRTLGTQMDALRAGRTEAAGPLVKYAEQAQQRVTSLADRLQQRGFQGVVDDVAGFARRRPGMFLAGCFGAGFVLTRLARSSGTAVHEPDTDGAWARPPARPSASYANSAMRLGPPNPAVVQGGLGRQDEPLGRS